MYLVEKTGLQPDDLPIAELRGHLRLGTGFGNDSVQDPVLARSMLASVAQIETLTGKAILRRGFVWTVPEWRDGSRQIVPRAPLVSVTELVLLTRDGERQTVDQSRIHVDYDMHRPAIVARSFALPRIPWGGRAELHFEAGYATSWSEVPSDLSLAVFSLAAALYEDRVAAGTVPDGVNALLSPYRQPRFWGSFR